MDIYRELYLTRWLGETPFIGDELLGVGEQAGHRELLHQLLLTCTVQYRSCNKPRGEVAEVVRGSQIFKSLILIEKKIKLSLYIKKFRMDRLQSHV